MHAGAEGDRRLPRWPARLKKDFRGAEGAHHPTQGGTTGLKPGSFPELESASRIRRPYDLSTVTRTVSVAKGAHRPHIERDEVAHSRDGSYPAQSDEARR